MTKVVRRRLASRLFDWSSRRLGYGNDDPATNGEFRLLAELPERPTVFDVGANRGDYAQGVLERKPGAHVHCFEPSPTAFAALLANLGDRAILHNVALDSTPGQAVLYADERGSGLSSLYRRDLRALGMPFGQQTESVVVSTLDIEADQAGVDHVDLLKIDAEGAEARVIEGAARMIETGSIDMLVIEYGGTALDSHRFVRDYYALLADRYDLYRVLPDGLLPLGAYREAYERAEYMNFCALRR
jgi:FkbM family methyltransferase